jgi:hypothetical protein
MMTPDQIRELAEVGANYKHIMSALNELKDNVRALPTHADLKVYATSKEVDTLRAQVEELKQGSPKSIAIKAQVVALWLAAIAGAVSTLLHLVKP